MYCIVKIYIQKAGIHSRRSLEQTLREMLSFSLQEKERIVRKEDNTSMSILLEREQRLWIYRPKLFLINK